LRLDFRTTLFATGAVLRPSLQQRGSTTSTWQRVDGGNAIALGTGNTTTLVSSVGQARLIREVVVRPPAFSPNGDGINDETAFEFKVVRVGDDSPAEVWVYDLAGRLMRRLVEQRKISTGEHALRWDGRDQTGEVVPPGIYYARLRVATETDGAGIENAEVLRTVSVAY
jgi:flagellar hook assembly protein FlgD